jgi:hypothetical protein
MKQKHTITRDSRRYRKLLRVRVCYKGFTKLFQGCYKGDTKVLHTRDSRRYRKLLCVCVYVCVSMCDKVVIRVLQEFFRSVTRVLQG